MNPDDEVVVHVLGHGLSDRDVMSLKKTDSDVRVYDVSSCLAEEFLQVSSNWPAAIWDRILIPEILPKSVDRVLYLDCDVVVNDSLDDLFTMSLDSKSVAGCLDTQDYDMEVFHRLGYERRLRYICTGVLLMNLKYWRTNNLKSQILEYAVGRNLKFPDQDAINHVCCNSKIVLSPMYGVLVTYFRNKKFMKEHYKLLPLLLASPQIIHYAGYQPWNYAKNKSAHGYLWWRYCNNLDGGELEMYCNYFVSYLKYQIRFVLSKMHFIGRDNKYSIYQYYYHPRISEQTLKFSKLK